MDVGPVLISEFGDLTKLVMAWKVNDLVHVEPDAIFVNNVIDLLIVIYYVEGLLNVTFSTIILYILTVCLERSDPASSQLKDFLLRDFANLACMQFQFKDFLTVSTGFCEVDLILISSH